MVLYTVHITELCMCTCVKLNNTTQQHYDMVPQIQEQWVNKVGKLQSLFDQHLCIEQQYITDLTALVRSLQIPSAFAQFSVCMYCTVLRITYSTVHTLRCICMFAKKHEHGQCNSKIHLTIAPNFAEQETTDRVKFAANHEDTGP